MNMADRITQRLKDLGLSRRAASEKAELSETFIRDVIDGRARSPRMESLEKLAGALETTVEWLRSGQGDPNQVQDAASAQVLSIMPTLDAAKRRQVADFARYLSQQAPAKRDDGG